MDTFYNKFSLREGHLFRWLLFSSAINVLEEEGDELFRLVVYSSAIIVHREEDKEEEEEDKEEDLI